MHGFGLLSRARDAVADTAALKNFVAGPLKNGGMMAMDLVSKSAHIRAGNVPADLPEAGYLQAAARSHWSEAAVGQGQVAAFAKWLGLNAGDHLKITGVPLPLRFLSGNADVGVIDATHAQLTLHATALGHELARVDVHVRQVAPDWFEVGGVADVHGLPIPASLRQVQGVYMHVGKAVAPTGASTDGLAIVPAGLRSGIAVAGTGQPGRMPTGVVANLGPQLGQVTMQHE
jgi:hypothetical protein